MSREGWELQHGACHRESGKIIVSWVIFCGHKKTTTYLEDSLGGLVEDVLGEVVIVHGQTDTREEVEKSLVLLVAEDTSHVGKSGRVSHVNGDGVTVTKRRVRDQLVERRPAWIMSVRS
jgi:hypothetical protein